MPLLQNVKIPDHVLGDEGWLKPIEWEINEACLHPSDSLDTVVQIDRRMILEDTFIEKLLRALQEMHRIVGERTSFRRITEGLWEFTVHYDNGGTPLPIAA